MVYFMGMAINLEPQITMDTGKLLAPKQLSLEEQIGSLNAKVRQLSMKIERLEHHSHLPNGEAAIEFKRLYEP